MRLFFRGREFDIIYTDLGVQIDGECSDENETIEIDMYLKGMRKMETEIHESLHACLPMLEEKIIEPTAADIAAFLWKLGYRLK